MVWGCSNKKYDHRFENGLHRSACRFGHDIYNDKVQRAILGLIQIVIYAIYEMGYICVYVYVYYYKFNVKLWRNEFVLVEQVRRTYVQKDFAI